MFKFKKEFAGVVIGISNSRFQISQENIEDPITQKAIESRPSLHYMFDGAKSIAPTDRVKSSKSDPLNNEA